MGFIDLRSDTVTKPTEGMRAAISSAVVGDDVYGEDPTVNHPQKMMPEELGMEARLFVASGTMGNIAAILTHAERRDDPRSPRPHVSPMPHVRLMMRVTGAAKPCPS